ncbi:MAG: 4-hydroxy-tetrahydrodipicolinate reductase [Alphaproteobacteria bacterium]|nr:MAG: 4-hydroxy-tetrahydrodipicolinate reductase [Alphaproteobacteria bacterium]
MSEPALRIAVAGARGRMGRALIDEIVTAPDLRLAAAGVRPGDPEAGMPVEGVPGLSYTDAPEALFERADVVVDFTLPAASRRHLELAAAQRTAIVIGTTGWQADDEARIAESARHAPVLVAANFSLGVNLLIHLAARAARALGEEFAVEILDLHHGMKRDAPSGTALALGRALAAARGEDFETLARFARTGETGPRESREIGFGVLRGGDVAGEHTVFFLGTGERLELAHRAHDRRIFARGALSAARWLARNRPPGRYAMADVLGLRDG